MPLTKMADSVRHISILAAQVASACLLSTCALAQQPQTPRVQAPPPMRFVSRVERTQLDAARDPKARLRATIKLAEDRLTRAETLTTQKAFDEASIEIGGYLGLIGDLRAYIATLDKDKGSTRDINRHMEISVRPHIARLAVIRRDTPATYSMHLKDAEEYVKETRSEALDSFYGHSVLREPTPQEKALTPKDPPNPSKRP